MNNLFVNQTNLVVLYVFFCMQLIRTVQKKQMFAFFNILFVSSIPPYNTRFTLISTNTV